MSKLIADARAFSFFAHLGQTRKYTGEPYSVHPAAVAALVDGVGGSEAQVAAAYLHDVVEDTEVTLDMIRSTFGDEVANLVEQVTDVSRPEDGDRATRKALDLAHIAQASRAAMTIKLADIIHNARTTRDHDPAFWKTYRAEKAAQVAVLRLGDQTLWRWAAREVAL